MQARSKGAPVVEDPEPKGLRAPERRIDIQPAEDEEDPGTFWITGGFIQRTKFVMFILVDQ